MKPVNVFFCVFILLIAFQISFAKQYNDDLTPGIEETQSSDDGLEPWEGSTGQDEGSKGMDAGFEVPETSPGNRAGDSMETYTSGERALISGVPVYHQQNISSPWICAGHDIKTGCGPVAASAIAAWWERRGFEGMMTGSQNNMGIPEDTIVELAKLQYVGILPNCSGTNTATLPDSFGAGLEDYLEDNSGIEWDVSKHKITEESNINYLWGLVKSEINKGRPMVYLYRADGSRESDGYLYSTHYGIIVGYDELNSRRNLILQNNWGSGNWTYPYMNTYASDSSCDDNTLISLGHYARPAAAINFNIYTIVPGEELDYKLILASFNPAHADSLPQNYLTV